MIVTLSYVSTLNGKITLGSDSDVRKWSSKEDQAHFKKLVSEHDVIVRSSTTYEIAKPKPQQGKLQVVLTRDPGKYKGQQITRQLEFTSEPPKDLIKRLKSQGKKKVLLAVGSTVVNLFLKAKLIDQFILTLEPKLFGSGVPMLSESDLNLSLNLTSFEKINSQGTLVLTYSINYY